MQFTEDQARFCNQARSRPTEISLRYLVDLLAPQSAANEGVLTRLAQLGAALELVGLEVLPGLENGDLETPRLVTSKRPANVSESQLLAEINDVENDNLELKSSFSCCIRTLRAKEGLEPKQYQKPAVEDSLLCAVAGMMNASGGLIFVGVEDNHALLGLGPDFHALGISDSDRWLLKVRDKITSSFHEGVMINDHIAFSFHEVGGLTIARAVIRPRRRLALVAGLDGSQYHRIMQRQGNRTVEIKPVAVEEFFEERLGNRRQVQ